MAVGGEPLFVAGVAAMICRTDSRGKEPLFTDGPFAETKEYLAGFWVIKAPNRDVALKIAAEGSRVCNR